MYTTKSKENTMNSPAPIDQRISTDAEGLAAMLGCGRATAVKIGSAAGARFVCGKRTLYVIPKVKQYLENESGE